MDIENQIESIQEQLPQIRRVTTLREIKRFETTGIPPLKPLEKVPGPRRFSLKVFIIGLIFFSILGVELAMVYRYDKINKRLYQISVALKDKLLQTRGELNRAIKANTRIARTRNTLLEAYREGGSLYSDLQLKYNRLQFREDDYKRLLNAKTLWLATFKDNINVLQGDLRVFTARVEALKVQKELLATQIKEKDERLRDLTTRLINNIGEQELLVNKNLKLQEERDQLARELLRLRPGEQAD